MNTKTKTIAFLSIIAVTGIVLAEKDTAAERAKRYAEALKKYENADKALKKAMETRDAAKEGPAYRDYDAALDDLIEADAERRAPVGDKENAPTDKKETNTSDVSGKGDADVKAQETEPKKTSDSGQTSGKPQKASSGGRSEKDKSSRSSRRQSNPEPRSHDFDRLDPCERALQ